MMRVIKHNIKVYDYDRYLVEDPPTIAVIALVFEDGSKFLQHVILPKEQIRSDYEKQLRMRDTLIDKLERRVNIYQEKLRTIRASLKANHNETQG